MGAVYTDSQKKATYKWRDANRDKKRASDVRHIRWKKIKIEFLSILLI
jgi:hypothetical protein